MSPGEKYFRERVKQEVIILRDALKRAEAIKHDALGPPYARQSGLLAGACDCVCASLERIL
jgi:hypothetical protein